VTAALLSPRLTFARLVALDKPPAVLADRAEQILAATGYTEPRGDTRDGFQIGVDVISWIARTDPLRAAVLSGGAVRVQPRRNRAAQR
jgi:hypothetical protein